MPPYHHSSTQKDTVRHLLAKQPSYGNTTLWAMCSLAFFGFLRVSEFTIPTEGSYDPSCHLSLQDITVDNRTKPCLIQLFLEQSKADPFKQDAKVYIGTICLVKVLLSYMARRNSHLGLLFITKEGKGWTKSMFHTALQHLLENLRLSKKHYNTHSFCIGAATTASLENIADSHIQTLGQWRSNAFQRYIRPPPTELLQDAGKRESLRSK